MQTLFRSDGRPDEFTEGNMPAYLISDVTVRDAKAFEAYRNAAAGSIKKYGGKYLARGGGIEVLEGDWTPRAIILVEFPSTDRAREWYSSPEYQAALKYRAVALSRNLVLIDGVPLDA